MPPIGPSIGIPSAVSKTLVKEAQPLWQRVRTNAARAFNLKTMPIEDKVLFWSGFMYVPSAILTPAISNWQLQHSGMPTYERNLIVKTEVARQLIGATAHFIGFFGGLLLFGLGGKSNKPKTFQKLIGSMLGATVSYAFVRPWLVNAYTARWVSKNRPEFLVSRAFFSAPQTKSHNPLRPTALPHGYHALKPLLFQAYAGRVDAASSLPSMQARTKPPNTLAMA
ncbi:MAG: hypothetical protein QE263_05405 [Vampirovibrionales bacterium]|nr:hypothetical protein [Vampirovibrionales bacterium]